MLETAHRIRGNGALFSRNSDEWETPHGLFTLLDAEFHFTLDVCATPANAKCARFFTKSEDGLMQCWEGACWMNPPYSEISLWMAKAVQSAQQGATVVCLVPSRTDTSWWHGYAIRGEIRFVRGRLRFAGQPAARHRDVAPFPSSLVIFRGPCGAPVLGRIGYTLRGADWSAEQGALPLDTAPLAAPVQAELLEAR